MTTDKAALEGWLREALRRGKTVPGPRCCKRVLFLATQALSEFAEENLGLKLKVNDDIRCHYYKNNKECLGKECPFFIVRGGFYVYCSDCKNGWDCTFR